MTASPLHPIVIWFGRVGDMILLSALLDVLAARYGGGCHVIGAGSWPGEIYATHSAVARVSALHRYTAWVFDPAWWRTARALRAARADPVYVCETDPRKLARIRRLLAASGTDPRRCLMLAPEPAEACSHWVDRLVSLGRLTPPAFDAAAYPWPCPAPPGAPRLEVSAAAQADCDAWLEDKGWRERPLVLVQPGNRRTMRGRRLRLSAADDKAWPLERWGALLHRLHARLPQALIVLCGAPRESLLLEWIAAAAALPAVVAAELPLPRLLALCMRAHSMISVDSGPAHAAAALGLPSAAPRSYPSSASSAANTSSMQLRTGQRLRRCSIRARSGAASRRETAVCSMLRASSAAGSARPARTQRAMRCAWSPAIGTATQARPQARVCNSVSPPLQTTRRALLISSQSSLSGSSAVRSRRGGSRPSPGAAPVSTVL
ncbi:MAG: glycosyltransferase family 9 protein [Gammaproteobacteria bacterium]|nr:MAG: glycosyltransferase family 9 protein [Gammaproteobacteria bacterium]